GPLWSLPCEAILYLILFALGRLRLLVLPVTLIMLAVGIVCLWFDTSGSTFGSVFWLMGFFAAGMCAYRLRRRGLIAGRWAALALAGLVLGAAWGVFVPIFPLCGSYLVLYLALERRLPAIPAARFAAVVPPALAFASCHLVEKRCRLGRRRLAPAGAAAD